MSSPAQAGPSVPKDKEKKGFGKMLSRMKTVLKKDKRKSTIAPTAGPSTVAPLVTPSEPAAPESKPKPKPRFADVPGATRIPWAQLHEERARRLGERYGLEIKPSEWHSTEGHAVRVDKPIRMRVHRQCHKCKANFGIAKECPSCQHPRCKQCLRYPPRRTEEELAASRIKRAAIVKERAENAPIVPDWNEMYRKEKIVLKKPSKTGGQDLIHKKPRQRVRRTCHECKTLFQAGSKECANCSHIRCTDCPRDPAKRDKYPYGYPGDVFGPNSIPHYECHRCKTKYPPAPEPGTECTQCQHKKCDDCPRLKPRKVEPEPDPAILQSITAKIEAMKLK